MSARQNLAQNPANSASTERTKTSSSPLTRRHLLRIVGGTSAFIAVTAVVGGGARAVDQGVFETGQGTAYLAWDDWRPKAGEGPLDMVRAAVLAANAHNAQPWLFRVEPSGIDLFADTTRGTGANDPLGRELVISLGCALENLTLSASPSGFAASATLFPNPADPNHVAHVDLVPGEPVTSALYDAIPHRHTNRGAYTDTPVTNETLGAMTKLNDDSELEIVWLTSPDVKRAFAALTVTATEAYIADTQQSIDSFKWWRGDWDALQAHKDGITIDAGGLSPLTRALGKLVPAMSRETNDTYWLDGTKDQVSTAAAFGIIVARDHRAAVQRLGAGRLFQRLNLWATTEGLAMQPINQTVERRDRELQVGIAPEIGQALNDFMPEAGWQAVLPFRVGYPREHALKSPRRPAEDVVTPGTAA